MSEETNNKSGKMLLIVDDEEDILKTVSYQLKAAGYRVMTAKDGEEALERAREEKPDLVILDLMLPKIDGLSVCGLLKRDIRHAHTPVVLFTARVGAESKALSEEVGADAYITKPFEAPVLLKKIEELLNLQEG